MGLTVDEFVADTITAMDELQTVEEGQRFGAFALGVLAGAALQDRIVFPSQFVDRAAACRSMAEINEMELLLKQFKGVAY